MNEYQGWIDPYTSITVSDGLVTIHYKTERLVLPLTTFRAICSVLEKNL